MVSVGFAFWLCFWADFFRPLASGPSFGMSLRSPQRVFVCLPTVEDGKSVAVPG